MRTRAIALAYAALDTGRNDPFVALLSGWVLLAVANDPLGIEMVRRGLTANPNNLVALNLGGLTNLIAGDLDASAECYARAHRLSPMAPDAFWSLTGLGWVDLKRGNDATALDWFERSLATGNEWAFTLLGVIAALALSGETQERGRALSDCIKWPPNGHRRTSEGASRCRVGKTAPRAKIST